MDWHASSIYRSIIRCTKSCQSLSWNPCLKTRTHTIDRVEDHREWKCTKLRLIRTRSSTVEQESWAGIDWKLPNTSSDGKDAGQKLTYGNDTTMCLTSSGRHSTKGRSNSKIRAEHRSISTWMWSSREGKIMTSKYLHTNNSLYLCFGNRFHVQSTAIVNFTFT